MTFSPGGLVVIWIDWYAYHIARFRALIENPQLAGRVFGIELVGGTGVHPGFTFRHKSRGALPIATLEPDKGWHDTGKLALACKLWRELSRLKPASVLIPGYYTWPGIAAAVWCRLHGSMPILMTESAERDHRRSTVKEAAKGFALRVLFDRAICGGQAHKQYLLKLGMKGDRIGDFYDTVDNGFFASCATQLRSGTTAERENLPARYFLFAGRLAHEKNVGCLLAAFSDYRARGGTWELVIAGDGPLRTALGHQAAAAGISPWVRFLGFCTAEELLAPYAFASCFILPSLREPWGLVVNEAMAAGLPVLVSARAGCAPDLVESGGNGWTFDPTDTGLLCRLLLRVGNLEGEALAIMGQRSAEIVSRYSPEDWAIEVARLTFSRLGPVSVTPQNRAVEAR